MFMCQKSTSQLFWDVCEDQLILVGIQKKKKKKLLLTLITLDTIWENVIYIDSHSQSYITLYKCLRHMQRNAIEQRCPKKNDEIKHVDFFFF